MKATFLIISILLIVGNYILFGVGSESDMVTWFILIFGVCVIIDIFEMIKREIIRRRKEDASSKG